MDAHRRCRPFYTSSGAHERLDARRGCPIVPSPSSKFLYQKARLKSHHRAATHQPLVAARKVLWTSKTLPGDHFSRYGHCQRPRCLLCSSSPTPHCLPGTSVPPSPEPCSSSPTPHYLPGMPVPPPGALPLSQPTRDARPKCRRAPPPPPPSTSAARDARPKCRRAPPLPPPTTEPRHINHLSRHGKCTGRQRPCPATTFRGAAGQRPTSTTTARLQHPVAAPSLSPARIYAVANVPGLRRQMQRAQRIADMRTEGEAVRDLRRAAATGVVSRGTMPAPLLTPRLVANNCSQPAGVSTPRIAANGCS